MAQEPGCVPVHGKRIQQSRSGEQGMVSRGDDAGNDNGVDETACNGTAGLDKDNGKRAGSGGFVG